MRRSHLTALLFLGSGCLPELDESLSTITAPRLIAVVAEPPEARPDDAVTLTAIVADPDGGQSSPQVAWSLCLTPKLPTENGAVSPACLGMDVAPLGPPTPKLTVRMPTDACQRFGPDVPPSMAGQPPGRPRDPDPTGGYYQPVRAELQGKLSFVLPRLRCNLAGASLEVAQAYSQRYTDNRNPTLLGVTFNQGSTPLDPSHIPAGTSVAITATWSDAAAEIFPVLDLQTGALVERREAVQLSWYVTRGQLALERTGRDPEDEAGWSQNTWTAPTEPGPVHLWIVVRDSRGGLSVSYKAITIQ